MASLLPVPDILRILSGPDASRFPWNELYDSIGNAFAERDGAYISNLLEALDLPLMQPKRQYSAAGHLGEVAFRALASIPGEAHARRLLSLASRASGLALLGAALASSQSIDLLARLCTEKAFDAAGRTLLMAWAHETVYHDAHPLEHPGIVALANEFREEGHALGRVPLSQTAVEATIPKVPPSIRPRSFGSWNIRPPWLQSPVDGRAALSMNATEVTKATCARRIPRTFHPDGVPNNVRVEARRFLLAAPISAESLGAPLLRLLEADCMTGRTDEEPGITRVDQASVTVQTRQLSPADALAWFLHFAISWRCYGEYSGVGPGRERAFDAMAALCDLGSDVPWDEVARALSMRSFVYFEADTPWFYHICEDFGCLVLDPSRTIVDVIAETDCD